MNVIGLVVRMFLDNTDKFDVCLCVILKNRNHSTDYVHLWISLFVTFTDRFEGIKCLIYSHNMPEITLQYVGRYDRQLKWTSFH